VRNLDDARVALLERLIDHAPLFPPSSLPLPVALAEDKRAHESTSAFALGRFVCPASRLHDLPTGDREISAVLDVALAIDSEVEAIETRLSGDLGSLLGKASEVYVEVPLDDDLETNLDLVATAGLRAKVRCGGASVPSTAELGRFVRACGERALVFKATAGLHSALRRDGDHGFLNLLAAVVFGDETEALEESDPRAFTLGPEAFSWRGRAAGADVLRKARRERLHSIGSCSFFEPVAELKALGVLPL
jgi:hypothetical protein